MYGSASLSCEHNDNAACYRGVHKRNYPFFSLILFIRHFRNRLLFVRERKKSSRFTRTGKTTA